MSPVPGEAALEESRGTAEQVREELAVYRAALSRPQTPTLARGLRAVAVGYVLLAFDIPDGVMEECRGRSTREAS